TWTGLGRARKVSHGTQRRCSAPGSRSRSSVPACLGRAMQLSTRPGRASLSRWARVSELDSVQSSPTLDDALRRGAAAAGDQRPVHPRTSLRDASLGGEIDIDEAEAAAIAGDPF